MARRERYYKVAKETGQNYDIVILSRGEGRTEAERRFKEYGKAQKILSNKTTAAD